MVEELVAVHLRADDSTLLLVCELLQIKDRKVARLEGLEIGNALDA